MTKRTTIKIDDIKDRANAVFRDSVNGYRDQRKATQAFVERILLDAGQYKGFRCLTESDFKNYPHSETPVVGIIFDESPAHEHQYPDDSRISFY